MVQEEERFQGPPTWDIIREMFAGTEAPRARLDASLWAIDVMAQELGDDWPRKTYEKGKAGHLVGAIGGTADNARLIEFAMRLRLVRDRPGRRKALRPFLTGDITDERIRHTDLLLEVATLGMPLGWGAELEKKTRTSPSDVDVRLTREGVVLDIEVCSLLQSDRTKASFSNTDKLFGMDLHVLATMHGVGVSGELHHDTTMYDVDLFREQVMSAIRLTSADGEVRLLAILDDELRVAPLVDGDNGGVSMPFDPAIDPGRLDLKIQEKVEQARSSGAKWVRVDLMDLAWQFGDLAQLPLEGKALVLGEAVHNAVGQDHSLDGVVISSGALFGPDPLDQMTKVPDDGIVAMCREIEPIRARQTVMVPLTVPAIDLLIDWMDIFSAEPKWLDWGLEHFELPAKYEIWPWLM